MNSCRVKWSLFNYARTIYNFSHTKTLFETSFPLGEFVRANSSENVYSVMWLVNEKVRFIANQSRCWIFRSPTNHVAEFFLRLVENRLYVQAHILHLSTVELRCKLREKLHRVTAPNGKNTRNLNLLALQCSNPSQKLWDCPYERAIVPPLPPLEQCWLW